jgi:selenocysteine lyase/cysteine desulfurase
MLDAAIELLQEWTVPAIQAYCAELVAPLRAAAAMRGWSVSSGASHIVGLRLPAGGDPSALRARMDAAGVSVSLRGSAVRVSPHVYNDEADVAALIAVLEEML